jgi:hypothetical protein
MNDTRLHIKLATKAFFREIFIIYLRITASIKNTSNSPPITYIIPFHKKRGKIYRRRGNVIVEASIHVNNTLAFFTGYFIFIQFSDAE